MKMFRTFSLGLKTMTVLLNMILTHNSVCSSSQVVYNNQPYGPEMCNQLTARIKGCSSSFYQETFTCIIYARQHIIPEICLTTKKKKLKKCTSLKPKEEANGSRSEPVHFDRNGAVISGSIQQLLNSVKVGIQIQPLIMLPNKQILLLDVSLMNIFGRLTANGSKTNVCVFSDTNVGQAHGLELTTYQVCLKGQLTMNHYGLDKTMLRKEQLHCSVIWYQFFSLQPFTYFLYGNDTSSDERSVELKEMVQLIKTASDVILSETKRRRDILAIVVPASNGKIGFYMSITGMSMICKLIPLYKPTDIINCRNIVSNASQVSETDVKSVKLLISKPWNKGFETGNALNKLDELMRLIRIGHRVKIMIGLGHKTVVEAAVVFIQRTGFVCGQFLSTQHYHNSLHEIWRYVSSKSSVIVNNDVYGTTNSKFRVRTRGWHVSWFVDPFPWEFAFHVRDNGTEVFGSRKQFVKNFQHGPLKVRVETTFEKYTIYESATRVKVDLQNEIVVAYMTPHFNLEMDNLRKFRRPKYNSQKIYCTVSSTALRSCEEIPSMVKTEVNVESRWFIQK